VVVGLDPKADVGLMRLDHPVRGHVFTSSSSSSSSSSSPRVGQEVAAMGFPEGKPMTFTRGTVSLLDLTVSFDDLMRSGMIETEGAVISGYSGAPLLSADGQVMGLIDAAWITYTRRRSSTPAL
jgi:serine protease Do